MTRASGRRWVGARVRMRFVRDGGCGGRVIVCRCSVTGVVCCSFICGCRVAYFTHLLPSCVFAPFSLRVFRPVANWPAWRRWIFVQPEVRQRRDQGFYASEEACGRNLAASDSQVVQLHGARLSCGCPALLQLVVQATFFQPLLCCIFFLFFFRGTFLLVFFCASHELRIHFPYLPVSLLLLFVANACSGRERDRRDEEVEYLA